jgi:hypothetical protein
MEKIMKIPILLFVFLLMFGCQKEKRSNCTKSWGKQTQESRVLDNFKAIYVYGNIEINLIHSSENKVIIKTGENMLDLISTEIENDTLYIKDIRTCNWVRSFKKDIQIDIYFKNISGLYLNNATGNITAEDTLKLDTLNVIAWDTSGDIILNVNTNVCSIALHRGVAYFNIQGFSGQTFLYSAGLGKIEAENLISTSTFINNSSASDMKAQANQYLFVFIKHGGNVHYKGNPSKIDKEIIGNGKLLKL